MRGWKKYVIHCLGYPLAIGWFTHMSLSWSFWCLKNVVPCWIPHSIRWVSPQFKTASQVRQVARRPRSRRTAGSHGVLCNKGHAAHEMLRFRVIKKLGVEACWSSNNADSTNKTWDVEAPKNRKIIIKHVGRDGQLPFLAGKKTCYETSWNKLEPIPWHHHGLMVE